MTDSITIILAAIVIYFFGFATGYKEHLKDLSEEREHPNWKEKL